MRLRCPVCRQMHERSESGARLMTDHPTLVPDQEQDRNDGKEWSAADLEDLRMLSWMVARWRVPRTFCAAEAPWKRCGRRRKSFGS